jgi:hypothetical protein
LTRVQAVREIVFMESMEHDTAVEAGMVPPGPWHPEAPDEDHIDRVRHAWRGYKLVPIKEPLQAYRSSSPERLRGGLPGSDFATCPHCKLTYHIDYLVMAYAAGRAIHKRSSKPVIVHPGRVMAVGPDDPGPAFGITNSWRPTPWVILGENTPAPAT